MAAVVLVSYLLYLLTAFGLRSLQQYRRTGEIGFRGVTGPVGSSEWWGGLLFALALVLGLVAPALQLTEVVAPMGLLDGPVVRVAGFVLAGVGIVTTLVAQQSMGTSWRIGVDPRERTRLVTGGAFALVRNPIFTAMIVAGLGLTLLAPNPVAVVGCAALVAAIEIQVRGAEEPYLVATHGQTYLDYAARAGRFLPGIGHLSRGLAAR